MPLIFGRPFLATAKAKIDVDKGMISLKLRGKRKKFKVCELKNKPAAQGDAFLVDMMKVWSDESLENFFRKEEITFEKKKPPPLEPTKNGLSSLKSIFKRKVASKPDYSNRAVSFAGMNSSFFENEIGAEFDNEIPHGVTHQGYNPG